MLGSASDVRGLFADVMTLLEELQQDLTKRFNRVEEKAQQGDERLRGELEDAKSQSNCHQVQLIEKTDQCLAESSDLATKKSEEKDRRMTPKIERLLNDHDNTYAQTMTTLENRLANKADLMMQKLGELLSSSNQESRSGQRENSRQAVDGFRAPRHTESPPRLKTSFESNQRERLRAAPSRAGWTDPI